MLDFIKKLLRVVGSIITFLMYMICAVFLVYLPLCNIFLNRLIVVQIKLLSCLIDLIFGTLFSFAYEMYIISGRHLAIKKMFLVYVQAAYLFLFIIFAVHFYGMLKKRYSKESKDVVKV